MTRISLSADVKEFALTLGSLDRNTSKRAVNMQLTLLDQLSSPLVLDVSTSDSVSSQEPRLTTTAAPSPRVVRDTCHSFLRSCLGTPT